MNLNEAAAIASKLQSEYEGVKALNEAVQTITAEWNRRDDIRRELVQLEKAVGEARENLARANQEQTGRLLALRGEYEKVREEEAIKTLSERDAAALLIADVRHNLAEITSQASKAEKAFVERKAALAVESADIERQVASGNKALEQVKAALKRIG